ncbi:MAG: DNA mismatch repair protein MutS, partial [Clostridia bacterium]|nr:DNA mismatch repair protein MutS [Clostridia bacterium]
IVDRIFTRVGASDDLSSGQSTFMVEMNEVAYILDHATDKSLIILDEIGRGTSTFDGLGIAWAVVEHIADAKKCGAKTMFATHYHELTQLEQKIPNVKNYCIAVKKRGDSISFLRKIIRGGADQSYGVDVAVLAGVKKSVTKRAAEIVASLESEEKQEVSEAKIRTRVSHKLPEETSQMDFFGAAENPILTELKEMDLNIMTPVEALTKLFDLQAKAKNQ